MHRDYSMLEVFLKSKNGIEDYFAVNSKLPIKQLELKLADLFNIPGLSIYRGGKKMQKDPATPLDQCITEEGEIFAVKE